MSKRMCFFVYGYPPDFSGATMQAIKLARVLKRKGVEACFLSYTFNPEHLAVPQTEGFPLIRFLRPRENTLFTYHYRLLKGLFGISRGFDIIYINGNDGQFWTTFYLVLFKILFGKGIVMELNMEFDDPLRITGLKFEWLKKWASTKIDAYIPLSTAIMKRVSVHHKNLTIVPIFNGVDISRFNPPPSADAKTRIRKALGLPVDKKILLTCGGVSRRKGIDFLLDVWLEVSTSMENAVFVLLGPTDKVEEGYSGTFIGEIIARTKEEPFRNNVILCGTVSNVEDYMKAADVFSFAGRQEGSPNVIREAMASGLPVVSLELKDITSDMIEHNHNGIIIEVSDQRKMQAWQSETISETSIVKTFAEAVINLFSNTEHAQSLGSAARKTVEEKFTIDNQADQLIAVIEQIAP